MNESEAEDYAAKPSKFKISGNIFNWIDACTSLRYQKFQKVIVKLANLFSSKFLKAKPGTSTSTSSLKMSFTTEVLKKKQMLPLILDLLIRN